MEAIPHLHLDLAGARISRRCRPGPGWIGGPVADHSPQSAGRWTPHPVPEEERIALRVAGGGRPSDGSSYWLCAGKVRAQAGDHRRQVHIHDEEPANLIVIRAGRSGMLAVPDCYQHLAVAHVCRSGPPDPLVALAPAGHIHPESAGGRTAQEEPVLQGVSVWIRGYSRPLDPAAGILRLRPVGVKDLHTGRQIAAGQAKGDGLLDIVSSWAGMLSIPYPDLNLILAGRIAESVPGPDAPAAVAGVQVDSRPSNQESVLERIKVICPGRPDDRCSRPLGTALVRDK